MAASVRGVDALQDELERAKERLKNVDENIKRLTGRDPTEPRPGGGVRGRRLSAGGPAGEARGRGRLFAQARRAIADPDGPSPPKRRPLRGAFSRLGPRVMASSVRGPQRTMDSGDEEELPYKPTLQSSVIAAKKEPKSRTEIISAQNRDEKGKARNRRMFGLLMGTLQRFKDESATNEVVTKQRKAIEEKLEMKAKQEKEELKMERRNLFQERRQKQAKLRTLEQKLELARIHEEWERQTRALASSIRTKASPPVYWRPRRHNAASEKCLKETVKLLEGIIAERRQKLEEEIEALTQTVEEEKENEEDEEEEEKMETEDGEAGDREREDEGDEERKEGLGEVKQGEAMDTSEVHEPHSEAEKHTGDLGEGLTEQTDKGQGLATASLDEKFKEDMSSPIKQTDSGRERFGEETDRRHSEETGDKKSRRDSKSRRGSSRDEDPSKIGDHRRESRRSGEGHRRDSRGSKERDSKGSRHRRDSRDSKERDSRGSREEGTRGSKDSRDKDARTSREGESRGSRERDSQAGRDRDKEEKRKRSRTLSERSEEERSEHVQRRRVVMGPEDAEDGDRGGSWPKGDSVED